MNRDGSPRGPGNGAVRKKSFFLFRHGHVRGSYEHAEWVVEKHACQEATLPARCPLEEHVPQRVAADVRPHGLGQAAVRQPRWIGVLDDLELLHPEILQ